MITKEMFKRYVDLQMGGRTNMSDLPVVATLIWVTEDQVREIQRDYDKLEAKYK